MPSFAFPSGDHSGRVGVLEDDLSVESFVAAVLRPGLGEGFQFRVCGVASLRPEMLLDRSHLVAVKRQHPAAAQLAQSAAVKVGDAHRFHQKFSGSLGGEAGRQRAEAVAFYRRVGQQTAGQDVDIGSAEVAFQFVASGCGGSDRRQAQSSSRPLQLPGIGVCHTGYRRHLHHRPVPNGFADHDFVRHRINQYLVTQSLDVGRAELPPGGSRADGFRAVGGSRAGGFDMVHRPDTAADEAGDPDLGGCADDARLLGIAGSAHLYSRLHSQRILSARRASATRGRFHLCSRFHPC